VGDPEILVERAERRAVRRIHGASIRSSRNRPGSSRPRRDRFDSLRAPAPERSPRGDPMPPPIRVPWYTWRRFRVRGVVVEAGTGAPVAGYRVAAFDRDVLSDDFLGDCDTDAEGRFEIRFL